MTKIRTCFMSAGIILTLLLAAGPALAKEKKGGISGTWDCQAHGGVQGEMHFTLYLQEDKEMVEGNITSPLGGTQVSSGNFRHGQLELHFDLPQGSYTLMGKLEKGGKMTGAWSLEGDKGAWEGTKRGAPGH